MKIKDEGELIELTDELWNKWESEYQRNKLRVWLDKKFPNGLAEYGAYHTITHPWILVKHAIRHVKWAWQRVFRGWDDRVIWGIDYYLAEHISIWTKRLKEKKQGIPMSCFETDCENIGDSEVAIAEMKWNDILDKISYGFSLYEKFASEPTTSEIYIVSKPIFDHAMELFVEYFINLND